jgi:diacylglycerol kinase family enzyme
VVLARFALDRTIRAFKARDTPGRPVGPAERGVLIMNLRSGGGKAERFDLVEACRRRGIRPVVLEPGDDLKDLAREAIADGADVIGMAGGDGSQALVATVAAEQGVPMVVVPAGTRNHLALDLGLDRDDVVGALDAYASAVERTVDLADVNGRVFVNNVSLGLYATIVASPEYRAAKVDTTLAMLPNLLGPGTKPFDLRYRGPNGQVHEGAHIIQVSNNPYRKGSGSRPRLDTGKLGVYALEIRDDRAAAGLLTAIAAGDPERFSGFNRWETETFEVASSAPVDVGLDGEALVLDAPLRFSIRPAALLVRLPTDAIGLSPAARKLGARPALRSLWTIALGRPTEDAVTNS